MEFNPDFCDFRVVHLLNIAFFLRLPTFSIEASLEWGRDTARDFINSSSQGTFNHESFNRKKD